MSQQFMVKNKKTERFLTEYEGGLLLKEYGLPVVEGELAQSKEEAVRVAQSLRYPVVLKGMSPDITHKTEAEIVKVDIHDETELQQIYDEIFMNAKSYDPSSNLDGILVQKMVPEGLELIIGIKRDPTFGHQLIIGIGGIFVEILNDFSLKMMPVDEKEVEIMIRNLKGYPLLNGYRGREKINEELLKETVYGLNKLITDRPDIVELDLNPVRFFDNKVAICDTRVRTNNVTKGTHDRPSKSLDHIGKMMNPASIAVVGASANEKKNGGRLFRYIVENNYSGKLYPINPKADEIKGYKAYPNLTEVPGDIDLVCIIVGSNMVPKILEECATNNVKVAIIHSSGFAEIGDEGKKLQERIVQIADQGGIRLLGPNSMGITSPSKNIYTAFGSALEAKNKPSGSIGFVSQSGAMGSALLSRAWEQGAGFSRWISVANEADLNTSDFVNILAEDDSTKVISLFIEGITDAEAFKEGAHKALKNKKPILVYKTGKSDVGKRAVQSHTGTMAGDDSVYSAFFEKSGVLRVEHIEELIDVSRAFEIQPIPKGNRIGVITASGGACSVVADLCRERGLEVPLLNESAKKIGRFIPSFGSAQNPVDVTAEVIKDPEIYIKVLRALAEDDDLDGLIVMLTSNADPGALVGARAIVETFKQFNKPIVVGRLGADSIAPQAMEYYRNEKFPIYPTPEKAVGAMHYLVRYSDVLEGRW